MQCPADKAPLLLQSQGLWRCPTCAAHLLNRDAWDSFDPRWRARFQPYGIPHRPERCPRCAQNMMRRSRDDLAVVIDWCRNCQCVWVEKPDSELLASIRRRHYGDFKTLPDGSEVAIVEAFFDIAASEVTESVLDQVWDTFRSWWD